MAVRTAVCVILLLSGLFAIPARAVETLRPFIEAHCTSCHDADAPSASLDLESLAVNLSDPRNASLWIRVFDKVHTGEMPPADAEPPTDKQRLGFMRQLNAKLHDASLTRQQTEGRAAIRRLNRIEYENTLRDLLHTHVHVRELMPDDGSSAGFDTVGSALGTSPTHLVRFQHAAQKALNTAVTTTPATVLHERFTGRQWLEREIKNGRKHTPRGAVVDGQSAVIYHQTKQHWEMNVMAHEAPKVPDLYRIRMTAQARNTGGKPLPVRFGWEWMPANTQLTHVIAYRDVPADRAARIEVIVDLREREHDHRIGVTAYTLPVLPGEDKPQPDRTSAPALVLHDYEIEGPLGGWPSPGHKVLFGDLPLEPRSFAELRAAGQPVPTDDWSKWSPNNFEKNPLVPFSTDPKRDAERLIRAFLPRAFRGPVAPALGDYYVRFAHERLERGIPFGEALLAAYKAALCSPHVLLLSAKPGPLNDHALAARLSYFLWSSTPDDELLAVADRGELQKPDVLHAQVERMLNDPKCQRFIDDFTGQWLDLRKVLSMKPDEHYIEYDDELGWSLPHETKLFFREILQNDRNVTEFVESDWTMLNERLAKHYGIADVHGIEFRKVALKPEHHRGGVMTQASVLKATANGSYTSPVKRGAWVLERIVGLPPDPPPPDVPAIEPDIRGANTLRMQLEKHRELPACAGCHAKIDPPGFALESYDVIGGWRRYYRTANHGKPHPLPNYPELKQVLYAAAVETASVTAAGEPFDDITEYKKLLLKDPDQIARTITRKLIVYGTGADIQFADRELVEQIVSAARRKNLGLRTIIHEIVRSRVFRNK